MKFTRLLPRFDQAGDMATAQNSINNAKTTGENAINSFDPTTTAGAQQKNTNNLFSTQNAQTQDYIGRYTNAVKANPLVTDLYKTANNLYNVEPLAMQATALNNRLTNAVPDAYRAARGYDIDSTDINNGIAQKTAYLTPQANAATANYNTAAGLASNFVNAGITQNQMNLLPIQAEQQNLLQEQAAQATGWNQAAKSQFDGLIAKMQAGVQLSQAEMDAAIRLAQMEEDYNKQLEVNRTNVQTAQIGNQYKILSPAQTLVNTFTGKSARA